MLSRGGYRFLVTMQRNGLLPRLLRIVGLGRRAGASGCDTVSLHELAAELGHHDGGRAIFAFLRHPDDGGGPISSGRRLTPWHLTPEQADRVRRRFP